MEKIYTQKELIEKYNWANVGIADIIKYAKYRGVILERVSEIGTKPYKYKILDDSLIYLKWCLYPKDDYFEVAKEGFVRTTKEKRIVGALIKKNGYMAVTNPEKQQSYRIHRMVLETYAPVEGMDSLVVDHIDGVRDNNNITNLRWVTHSDNMEYKEENRISITQIVNNLIKKLGYNRVQEILEEIEKSS